MKKEHLTFLLRSPWLSGQLIIWVCLFVGSLIVALLLHFTSFDDHYLPHSTYLLHAFALLTGGFTAGKIAGRKGWYYGGLQGILYTLFLLCFSFLALDQMIQLNPFLLAIFAFGLSSIGGIFGEHTIKS